MRVPMPIIVAFLTAWLGLQWWELQQISELRVQVATLSVRIDQLPATPNHTYGH